MKRPTDQKISYAYREGAFYVDLPTGGSYCFLSGSGYDSEEDMNEEDVCLACAYMDGRGCNVSASDTLAKVVSVAKRDMPWCSVCEAYTTDREVCGYCGEEKK